ncbi:carbamate kinase [Halobaculum sp. P14]|uniref:amino acid kinase family protein n=1 Tax=Halobaculum sp. P14 TaxID=3421638 RepID=UPI003EBBD60E
MTRTAVALGGNAILRGGEGTVEEERRRIRETRTELRPLHDDGHDLLFTHGNGPQVGARLLTETKASGEPEPLDVLVAETQARIGYHLQLGLGDAFGGRPVVVLTRTRVDPDDPGFDDPSKPVGPEYTDLDPSAASFPVTEVHGANGRAYRRVVPSPDPVEVLEADRIRRLAEAADGPVICGGGGGVPVVRRDGRPGEYEGVAAVVDKDRTTRLLAETVGADSLLFLTDVDAAYRGFGTADEEPIREATPATLRDLLAAGEFGAGTMRPKVEAAAAFVADTGGTALITSPERLRDALDGDAGTRVVPAS